MQLSASKVIIVTLVVSCLCTGIGILIGYFAISSSSTSTSKNPSHAEDMSISEKLMNEISSAEIRENSRYLTNKSHIAGSDRDEVVLVNWIRDRWMDSGFDSVRVYSYDVLLSYPNQTDSNYVAIIDEEGNESEVSQRKEFVIDEEQNDPNVVNPFNAYSSGRTIQGDLVFVNYGTIEDFIFLNRTATINTWGKICIAKYGKIFRGDKVTHGQQYGCIGLILYSDPIDYTTPWGQVYPDGWFFPETGVQRGTLWVDLGDPKTPNYPSISSAWHVPDEDLNLPKIPVTPIGYGDAVKYLSKMEGPEVNETWRGGLNITYRYGPGFKGEFSSSKIKVSDKTTNQVATTRNVIGYIRGSVEPDRYVLIGNHRDAWVFGAIDPSSGTAVQTEIARGIGKMVKEGWRPRRTLVFCSWGAEEYGLLGSTEWVEELQKQLSARAVAYVNVDSSLNGNYSLVASGVASFKDIIYEATKLVENPVPAEAEEGRATVYETWVYRDKNPENDLPNFNMLGAGSDYTAFLHVFGIPAIDMKYDFDRSIGVAHYPAYHSIYETFSYVSEFVDPGFKCHQAVARILAEILRRLSDSTFLPIDSRLHAEDLAKKQEELVSVVGEELQMHGVNLTQLDEAIDIFTKAAKEFHERVNKVDLTNDMEVRLVNDQLMQLERAFIDQNPLLGRVAYRHVISAPSIHNGYGSTAFPGITDALFDIDVDPDQEGRWSEVKRQYSIVVFHILSAAATLEPVVP